MTRRKNNHKRGLGRSVPPLFEHVEIYFMEKGCSSQDALAFFGYYEGRHWKGDKGRPVKNWKTLACDWIWLMKMNQYKRIKALYEKVNLYPGKTN